MAIFWLNPINESNQTYIHLFNVGRIPHGFDHWKYAVQVGNDVGSFKPLRSPSYLLL